MTTAFPRLPMLGVLALAATAIASPLSAQATPPATPPTTHGGMQHGQEQQPARKPAMSHEGMSHGGAWPAMDEFHMLLMKAWHPVRESKDLAPARANAAAMLVKAEAWTRARAPESCGGDAARGGVEAVAVEARKVAALVERKASDAELTPALSTLHDRFEEMEKRCSAPAPATPPLR